MRKKNRTKRGILPGVPTTEVITFSPPNGCDRLARAPSFSWTERRRTRALWSSSLRLVRLWPFSIKSCLSKPFPASPLSDEASLRSFSSCRSISFKVSSRFIDFFLQRIKGDIVTSASSSPFLFSFPFSFSLFLLLSSFEREREAGRVSASSSNDASSRTTSFVVPFLCENNRKQPNDFNGRKGETKQLESNTSGLRDTDREKNCTIERAGYWWRQTWVRV